MCAACQDGLSRKQTDQIVSTLLEDLLAGIKTPERPRSPVNTYVTDEEIFRQKNPKVCCCHVPPYLSLFCVVFLCVCCYHWVDIIPVCRTVINGYACNNSRSAEVK